MKTLTVTPAYGRDYTSKAKAIADWKSGKDFLCADYKLPNRLINRADALTLDRTHIHIRYKSLTMVAIIPND